MDTKERKAVTAQITGIFAQNGIDAKLIDEDDWEYDNSFTLKVAGFADYMIIGSSYSEITRNIRQTAAHYNPEEEKQEWTPESQGYSKGTSFDDTQYSKPFDYINSQMRKILTVNFGSGINENCLC